MKYRIVVDDAQKAHEAQKKSYRNFPKLARNLPIRAKGTVHTEAESDCPEGMSNCRNCGDPEYKDSCTAAGHCPDCGTKHGIAPDSVVATNGYKLEAI